MEVCRKKAKRERDNVFTDCIDSSCFLSSVFWCFLCWDGRKMRQQKSKWNKMGSFFLVCWLGCLSLCLFICLIVLVLDGFSIYCCFLVFALLNHVCVRYCLFFGCFEDAWLIDWVCLYIMYDYIYLVLLIWLQAFWFVCLFVCFLFFDIFCLLVGMCLALGFLNFTIFCWRRRRRVEYKCPPDSNNEGRTNAATFWSVRRAHERWAP